MGHQNLHRWTKNHPRGVKLTSGSKFPALTRSDFVPGSNGISPGRLSHITELDLTDNLLCEWSEIELLVRTFPNLEFLNLSNNLLCRPLRRHPDSICLKMRKFVLNGNRLDWATINRLIAAMPLLEELHLGSLSLRLKISGMFCMKQSLQSTNFKQIISHNQWLPIIFRLFPYSLY